MPFTKGDYRYLLSLKTDEAHRLCTIAILLVLLLSSIHQLCASEPGPTLSDDDFLAVAKESLFTVWDPSFSLRAMKWTQPIQVGIISDDPISENLLLRFFEELGTIGSLAGQSTVVFGHKANLVVVFSHNVDSDIAAHANVLSRFFASDAVFEQYFENYKAAKKTCATQMVGGGTGDSIRAALIFLSVSDDYSANDINSCVTRSLLGAMGVPGAFGKLMEIDHAPDQFPEIDRTLVKLLYDPSIPSGIAVDDALPKFRQLLPKLRK